ncbi:MAG: restriction endonuclease subunit S [Ruminococcus flavefaciens]|nr:restriction endonuclease subunit S [Ruminococcus flavefaciens]
MGMKKTEIGMIPEEWDVQSFSDTFRILNNNTYSRAELNYASGQFRNIHYGDVLILFPEVLDCTREDVPYINDEVQISGSVQPLQDGDVVMADTAEDETVGKVTEVTNTSDKPVMSGLHTIPCRVKCGNFVPKWLGYYMNSHLYHDQLLPYIHGTKVSSVSKGSLGDTLIIVPKTPEQEKIIDALSDVDALIVDLERLIRKKKDIRLGTMQSLLSGKLRVFNSLWEKYVIGDIGDFYSGLTGKSKDDFGRGNARYVTFLNVLNNTVIDTSILESVQINEGEHQNEVLKGDLLFNTSSETSEEVGMCAVLMDSVRNTYLNSFCFGFRLKTKKVYALFLSYYFNSQEGRKIMRVLAQGATRFNLSKDYFSQTEIELPPYEDQVEIAQTLADIEEDIKVLEKKCLKYKAIKKGMMEQLLTGKVRLV